MNPQYDYIKKHTSLVLRANEAVLKEVCDDFCETGCGGGELTAIQELMCYSENEYAEVPLDKPLEQWVQLLKHEYHGSIGVPIELTVEDLADALKTGQLRVDIVIWDESEHRGDELIDGRSASDTS